MQFVLVIYHGRYPLPGTPEAERVSEEDKKAAYADFAALSKLENWSVRRRWVCRGTRRRSR